VRGIELVALLRPRGGDFVYGDEELAVLEADVEAAVALGLDGVALGCLTPAGAVDEERTGRLVERARPLAVTFHRAFDHVRDPMEALDALTRLGVERVLTSGCASSAAEGRACLAELVRRTRGAGRGPIVVAAGGIRPENVHALVRETGVEEVHCALSRRTESAAGFRNVRARLATTSRVPEDFAYWETDEDLVRALLDALP
jgi:copper homeostasis protein